MRWRRGCCSRLRIASESSMVSKENETALVLLLTAGSITVFGTMIVAR
ncbi:MAG: hypothetical protein GY847_36020 [Proteobacteria bacterium]|nr:hypothetical protein [Pseudomonadota bacterium]